MRCISRIYEPTSGTITVDGKDVLHLTPPAVAKLVASDVANEVCRFAVQAMGGYGYCREYPVERMLRDARITEIYEGTSEVMKMVISGSMKLK